MTTRLKRACITVVTILSLGRLASAQGIPSTVGWSQIPNTRLRTVCPSNNFAGSSYGFYDQCPYVVLAWNSAAFDTRRNRLLVWGGGHNDYFGNEIYSVDLNALTIQRLTDPAVPVATSCVDYLANGAQPNSRHTYDGIAYMANVDRLFAFGGSLSPCGYFSKGTWTLDLATNTWRSMNPSGTVPSAVPGVVTGYDPNTGQVFLHDDSYLYAYSYATNSYRRLSGANHIDYHLSAVVDPVNRKFVLVGSGSVYVYDISPGSSYTRQTLSTAGGSRLVNSLYPGLAFDSSQGKIVGWNGGDTVYVLDLASAAWTPRTFAGGPGAAPANGTYDRWSYSPASGIFALVNSMETNVYTLRLGATTADTIPPSVPAGLTASALSATQVNLTWSASTDNVAVSGYTVFRNGTQVATQTVTSFLDAGCTGGTSYTYAVAAFDAAGNSSAQSPAVVVTTPPAIDSSPPSVPTGVMASPVSSTQVNLTWSASTDNVQVVGYTVFRNGVQVATGISATSYLDPNLSPSTTYTYNVSAYDAAGNASNKSTSVTATTMSGVDTIAPTITNISVSNVFSSSAMIGWYTNEASDSQVEYGTTPCPCPLNTSLNTSLVVSHSVTLSGLTGATTYYYRVKSKDASGNMATSPNQSFVTASTVTEKVTTFRLTSPIAGTLPFTVGLAFKEGDIPGVPVLNLPQSQVVVKRRWPDNSVKHAVASGRTPLSAGTPTTISVLRADFAPTLTNLTAADIQSANPSASVQLGTFGTATLSALLASPFRVWVSGPEMVEAHYWTAVGSDPTLVVWFYVQLYRDGRLFIRAVVENGYLDLATGNKTYVPTVTIGGTTTYSNGGASLTHYAHTRWTTEGWIGDDPQITPQLDTGYLISTRLVPNYWRLSPSSSALTSLYQSYSPMQNGGWTPSMGTGGYQPQIGLLPLWDALYLTSSADSRAFKSVLANAKALNSYPILWRDSTTKLPTMPSNRSSWTVNGPNGGGETAIGAGSLSWDVAHHGSGGYLAYMITGDYYFLETMQHQSATCYLVSSASNGLGTSRKLLGQTRGSAWCQRTVAQLAALGPDDPVNNDYAALLANNISYWDSQRQKAGQNLIGYLYSYEIAGSGYGTGGVAPWQQHFWVQTYGYMSDIKPFADLSGLNAVRDFLYTSVVGILGSSGVSDYCYTKASAYTIKIAGAANGDSTTWYDSWGSVYQATYGVQNGTCGDTLEGSSGGAPTAASTGYWGNLLPGIAYAVDHGASGATAAWSRLTNAPNWSDIQNSGFGNIPIWGIVPRVPKPDLTAPRAPTNLRIIP